MHHSFALQTIAEAHFHEHVHGALLQDAGPHRRLDLGPASRLEDDRFDSAQMEEVREQQTRRACPDDADLGTHASLPRSWRGGCASEERVGASSARVS